MEYDILKYCDCTCLTLFLIFFLIPSCGSMSNSPYISHGLKDRSYSIRFDHSLWKELESKDADRSFQHVNFKSIIFANSFCKDYENVPLGALASNFLALPEAKVIRVHEIAPIARTFKGLPSMSKSARLIFMGKLFYIRTLTVKRSPCLYDFALIKAARPLTTSEIVDFKVFLDSIIFL